MQLFARWGNTVAMDVNERKIDDLENQFLLKSGTAFTKARKEAQASGSSVVVSENDSIIEIFPDGSRKQLKKIEPATQVKPGLKVIIR